MYNLQSTMAPLLTLAQLFSLSAPTVSTSILPNRSERATQIRHVQGKERERERWFFSSLKSLFQCSLVQSSAKC